MFRVLLLVVSLCLVALTACDDSSSSDDATPTEGRPTSTRQAARSTSTALPAIATQPPPPPSTNTPAPPAPTELPAPTEPPVQQSNCSPAYPGVCIPPPPPDLDCGDVSYRRFQVLAPDPHGFDNDGDGVGCESG